ncbi:MAG TPA: histidine kinase dimerization/phosphoacceptor domain -containing protein [Gemmataceae bacterium]|jgi:two-component system response regulator|nr:histidine kinase dimerization/phosphoacceptor domain -containing protein [Gemmataceae bacterium]
MAMPLRVLILEDNAADAQLMLRELRRAGFAPQWRRVDTRDDYVANLRPELDVILSDYNLPQFDALIALELLQESGLELPFIVVTGSISEEIAVACMKEGATDYLLKDRLTRLGQAVRRALHLHHLHDAQRQAEAALRWGEQRFRFLAENATDMISRLSPGGVFLYVSPACGALLGYAPEELVGRVIQDFLHPDDLWPFAEATAHILELPTTCTMMYRFRHADGRQIWFETTARKVCDEQTGSVLEIHAVSRDITERKQAEERIRASLREKELLLKEIHHRVKNNLQVISSLLSLQSGFVTDAKALEVLKESQNRVKSMALVHERLYQSKDLSNINFAEYVHSLVSGLFHSYAVNFRRISLKVTGDDVVLGIDTAIPCGLLIHELVSNALKHAFPAGRGGEIAIDLRCDQSEQLALVVRDNGIGFPKDIDVHTADSLGLQLVNTLTAQLDGTLELCGGAGTAFTITFKQLKYKDRGHENTEAAQPLRTTGGRR